MVKSTLIGGGSEYTPSVLVRENGTGKRRAWSLWIRLRPVERAAESFAMIAHDSPSLFEALPGS